MLKKIKHIWRIVALSAMAIAVLAIGVMSVRLLAAPIPIGWAVPWLESALQKTGGIAENLNISDLSLTWNAERQDIEFTADQVRLADAAQTLTAVERINLTLSLAALLRGELQVKDITLINPHLNLSLGAGDAGDVNKGEGTAAVMMSPGQMNALQNLRSIAIRGGLIILSRGNSGAQDILSNVQMNWQQKDASHVGHFSGQLRLAEDPSSSPLTANITSNAAGMAIHFNTTDIRPDALQNLLMVAIPDKMPPDISLNQIQMPISLDATLQLDANLQPQSITSTLSTGMGQVIVPDLYDRDVPVQSLAVDGRYDFTTRDWEIKNLKAQLLDPDGVIPVTFAADDNRAKNLLKFHLKMGNVNLSALKRWWPRDMAPGGYAWVHDNIHAGNIANTDIDAVLTRDANHALAIQDIKGMWELQGVTSSFLPPFMPITDVNGIATMDADNITFAMKYGRINNLEMQSAQMTISGLQKEIQTMALDASLTGQLPNVLAVLDTPPYQYAKKFGLNAATARGGIGLRLQIELPLLAALTLPEIKYQATANLNQVTLPGALMNKDITRGQGILDLTADHLKMDGSADLAGVPLQFNWQDHTSNADGLTRAVTFTADLMDDDHAKLGLPTAGYVKGSARLSGNYETKNNQNTLRAKMDLQAAEVSIKDLNYTKSAGVPMMINTTLQMADHNFLSLTATAKDLALDGTGVLNADMKPQKLDFGVFRFGPRTNAKLAFEQAGAQERWTITGQSFDASAMMGRKGEADAPHAPRWIAMKLSSLFLANQSEIKNLRAEFDHDGKHYNQFLMQGDVRTNTPLNIIWDKKKLSVLTNDAGAALRAFDITDTVRGGRLTIDGAGSTDNGWLARGKILMRDFKVVHAPFLAKLISLSSPGGLLDALNGDGVAFSRLDAPFEYNDSTLRFRDGKVNGTSLGLSFEGDISHNTNPNTLSVKGTIVPLYAINTALDKIPLVGDILGGNTGLLGFNYKASGDIKNPDVSVNPLSALTPGFLRNLLFDNSALPSKEE